MEIPLFPLHTVLAPGIALPLHIFEERYRVMIGRCLDAESSFGVVRIRAGREVAPRPGAAGAAAPPGAAPTAGAAPSPGAPTDQPAIAAVGTFAEIRQASRYPDGRLDILTVGAGRFLVQDVVAGREPYLVGIVEPIAEEIGDPVAADVLVRRVTRRFVEYLRLIQPRPGEDVEPIDVQVEVDIDEEDAATTPEGEPVELAGGDAAGPEDLAAVLRIPDDPVRLSHLLAGIVQVEPDRKQALLEAPTAEARLRALDALLARERLFLGLRLAPYAPDRRQLIARAS